MFDGKVGKMGERNWVVVGGENYAKRGADLREWDWNVWWAGAHRIKRARERPSLGRGILERAWGLLFYNLPVPLLLSIKQA